ncbi:DNA methyltransferase [Desulfitibacter alkalitolerans]|uniref:DNA methyltransferase n=1 Tax=Desulfitibacter alkalitolerans TaxID=264641 RepID=UPI001FA704A9|nr:DNA methyltransferase [Desulfitibacter alkalitolerans]
MSKNNKDTNVSSNNISLQSENTAVKKTEELKRIIPEAFKEGKIDFDILKQALGNMVDDSPEKYNLSWAGKSDCFKVIQAPSIATLKPSPGESINFDHTKNVIIEGDNLEVIKLLQKSYHAKVKMIYIDPPYNTGNEFVYPDNYQEGLDTYLRLTGQLNDEGFIISSNTDTNGRYHSKWLNMMYPRLFLARNLLRDDGVIFVSIDDHEVHNLRMMMDEIFGEENFLASIVWQKKYASSNDAKGIPDMHDYILVYQKSASFSRNLLPRTEKQDKLYKYDDNDGKGRWRPDNLSVKTYSKEYDYEIINPITGKSYYPPKGRCWVSNKATINRWINENRVFFGRDGLGAPQLKRYLSEVQDGIVPTSWWTYEDGGHNDESKKELKALFGDVGSPFDTPKPTRLVKRILTIATDGKTNDIILDFFAGSGTTAHAVMELNKEDGGNRQFILVQLPEPTDNPEYPTIAEICKERVRRVIKKLNEEAPDTEASMDWGFKVFKLSESNFKIWNQSGTPIDDEALGEQLKMFVNPIKPESRQEDILYELLIKSGFDLNVKLEKLHIANETVYSVAEGKLLICLANQMDKELVKKMIELTPEMVLCLDSAFGRNDQLKVNTMLDMKAKKIKFRTV